jgi:hypothetical protein
VCLCGNVKKETTIYHPYTISLSRTAYTYDGKAKKPSVTVKDSKGKKISSDYYSVKYDDAKKVGTHYVTITFKKKYSGTVPKWYTIQR